MFTLAAAQMLVLPGEMSRNLAHAGKMIFEAARGGADLVLLPEALDLGWTDPSASKLAGPIPGGTSFDSLRRAAREHKVYVCAGIIERAGERLYNSAILLDRAGELLLHYRKINELDFARELYSLGDRLGVVNTEFGRVGLMICADAFIPGQVITRTLGAMGAKCILSPCAWAVPADHDNIREPYGSLWTDNYRPVCEQFSLTIVGCSNVGPIRSGPWKGRRCIGNSLAVDRAGQVALKGGYGETAEQILYLALDAR